MRVNAGMQGDGRGMELGKGKEGRNGKMFTNVRHQKEQTAGKYILERQRNLVEMLRGNGEKFYEGTRGKRCTFRLGRW
jgi:hypothetical protein